MKERRKKKWRKIGLNWTDLDCGVLRVTCVVKFCTIFVCSITLRISQVRTRVNSGEEFKDLFTFSPPVYCAPQNDLYSHIKNHMKNPHGKCVAVLLAGHCEQRISANEKDFCNAFVAMIYWDFRFCVQRNFSSIFGLCSRISSLFFFGDFRRSVQTLTRCIYYASHKWFWHRAILRELCKLSNALSWPKIVDGRRTKQVDSNGNNCDFCGSHIDWII